MQENKEIQHGFTPAISPEWELFRMLQSMSWTELSAEPQALTVDMYRSVESGLTLRAALTSPKLKQLADRFGRDMVCRLVGLVLRIYTDRFPARSEARWGAWRLRQMAEWLYETYSMESLRDIMYAFRRMRHTYVPDVTTIMHAYLDWRASKLEELYAMKDREEGYTWPADLKDKLPDRWFLGYQNQTNGKNSNQKAA